MHAFEDIEVLDLTQAIAGPIATEFLGSLGADVVKIEPLGGDLTRGLFADSVFGPFNLGGKRSVCVDLRSDEGQQVVGDLAAEADVVVHNYRQGTAETFGLDYDTVSDRNPEVVYCAVSGFGDDGPHSHYPTYDPIVQAMSGLMSTTGYPDRPPARIGASVVDCGAGMNAAFQIAAALRVRDRTGEGAYLDVSMFDVAVFWISHWIALYARTGEVRQRAGSGLHGSAPNDLYAAGDGDPVYVCAPTDPQFKKLCTAIDRPDLAEDPAFETNADRWEHRERLRAELEGAFENYSAEELAATLVEAGVPAGSLQDIADLVENDPHVAARDMLVELEEDGEQYYAARPPFPHHGPTPSFGSPPKIGEHTRAVLEESGFSAEEVDALESAGTIEQS